MNVTAALRYHLFNRRHYRKNATSTVREMQNKRVEEGVECIFSGLIPYLLVRIELYSSLARLFLGGLSFYRCACACVHVCAR